MPFKSVTMFKWWSCPCNRDRVSVQLCSFQFWLSRFGFKHINLSFSQKTIHCCRPHFPKKNFRLPIGKLFLHHFVISTNKVTMYMYVITKTSGEYWTSERQKRYRWILIYWCWKYIYLNVGQKDFIQLSNRLNPSYTYIWEMVQTR
jgi:hypothetical protein